MGSNFVTGTTLATFLTPLIAALAAAISAWSTTISTGVPSPLGKCSPSFSSPMTESVRVVKASVWAKPSDFKVVEKPAKTMRTRAVVTQIARGLRSTKLPTFAQTPESFSSSSSKRGTLGQKIQRPNTISKAGNKVRAASIAEAIPIEPTGPSPRLLERSLKRRTINPAITVEPEATIGSTTPRSAIFMDSYRDS